VTLPGLQVAIALLGDSKVVLLDEPTSGEANHLSLGSPKSTCMQGWVLFNLLITSPQARVNTICGMHLLITHGTVSGFAPHCLESRPAEMVRAAGVDPVSRRALWEVLLKRKAHSAIMLVTHFIDEADILADQVGHQYVV